MEALNEYAGLIALLSFVVFFVLSQVVVLLLLSMHKKLSVQRLKFLGQFSADPQTRKVVAQITVSNPSLNDIAVTELGLANGRVNFNYTDLYKKQSGLTEDMSVVVGQRDAIRLVLDAEELAKALIQNEKGKVILKRVYFYAMDTAGTIYKGKIADVKKLLLHIARNGVDYLPPAFSVKSAGQDGEHAGFGSDGKAKNSKKKSRDTDAHPDAQSSDPAYETQNTFDNVE